MKYFTEDIEFTHSTDYFSEDGFLLNGVCYDKVILTKKIAAIYTDILKDNLLPFKCSNPFKKQGSRSSHFYSRLSSLSSIH